MPLRLRAPAPRRHYLRITGQPHPGLERKFEGLVRRHGLTVQNRATRGESPPARRDPAGRYGGARRSDLDEYGREGGRQHVAFMISPSSETQIAEVTAAVERLARVEQRLCLGVMD